MQKIDWQYRFTVLFIIALILFVAIHESRENQAETAAPAVAAPARAKPPVDQSKWRETDWSRHLAKQMRGIPEYVLPDGSRVDILTDDTAWEVEWSYKWPEAIGQAVFYGLATDRAPGVSLLVTPGQDENYLQCLMVCRHLDIKLQVTKVKK